MLYCTPEVTSAASVSQTRIRIMFGHLDRYHARCKTLCYLYVLGIGAIDSLAISALPFVVRAPESFAYRTFGVIPHGTERMGADITHGIFMVSTGASLTNRLDFRSESRIIATLLVLIHLAHRFVSFLNSLTN